MRPVNDQEHANKHEFDIKYLETAVFIGGQKKKTPS
jgi:hypothetical protein